jgi:hypothetical protein
MSNLTVNDRNQLERVELTVPDSRMRLRSTRGLQIYAAISTLILAALAYAAAEAISGWAAAVVLGMITLNAIGLMIAISPNRRG